jgi:Fe-S-cluster containining protein
MGAVIQVQKQYVISTPWGMARAEIDLPENPIRLSELPELLWPLAEACEALGRDNKAHGCQAVTCRAGCGACCRQLVTISPAEAWALRHIMAELPDAEAAVLGERFREVECALEREGFLDALRQINDPEIDAEAHYELAREYFGRAVACPFLEAESCSIHELRPLTCREYLVSTPAVACGDPFEQEIKRVFYAAPLAEALAMVSARKGNVPGPHVVLGTLKSWAVAEPDEDFDPDALLQKVILTAEMLMGIQ